MSNNLALKLIMNADDGISNVIKRAVNGADSEFGKLQSKLNQTSEKFTNFGKASMVAGGVIAAPLAFGIKKAADFEGQLSSIEAVTGATADEMQRLRTLALKMGADTKFSALEAAQGIEELEKAGLSTAQVLKGGLSGALSLAAAGDLNLKEAAEIASTALNAFKADNLSVGKAADILAGGANASATSVGELKYSLSACSSVASGIGMNFKDTNTALALFAQNGLKGSDAGTSLKSMLMNLQPRTDAQVAEFVKLGLATGEVVKVSKDGKEKYEMLSNAFFTSEGKLKSLSDISGLLKTKMAGLTDQQRMFALETMFGADAIRAGNILFKEGASGADKMWSAMSKVTAEQVASKKMDNLKGSIEELGGSIETVAISFGSRLTPAIDVITKGVTKLTNGFMAMPEPIQGVIAITGALSAVSLIGLGGISLAAGAVVKGYSGMLGAYRELDVFLWAKAPKLSKAFQPVSIDLRALPKNIGGAFKSMDGTLSNASLSMYTYAKTIPSRATLAFSGAINGLKSGFINFVPNCKKAMLAIRALNLTMSLNPVGAVIVALSVGALVVMRYWKPIKAFFSGLTKGLKVGLQPIAPIFQRISKAIKPAVDWCTKLFSPINTAGKASEDFGFKVGKAIGGAVTLCSGLIGKFEQLITLGGRIKFGGGWASSKEEKLDGSHSTGLSNVPFNGYVAELHQGEGVLTAQENRQWQGIKKGNSGSISITYAPNVQIASGTPQDEAKFLQMLKKHKQELLALIENASARKDVRAYA